jgi:signal transduction histidine kinase
MNGFELAAMIKSRKKTASVPIIFLTAYFSEDQHVNEGYITGAVDFLHKPINAVILRSKVAVFADLYRKTRENVISNQLLVLEIAERQRAEEALRLLNEELERRVDARTAELRESEEALREADRRKDEFLAMLGHELRNPLAAIRHAVRISHEAEDNDSQSWAHEVIDRQSNQLSRMVDDLLDVARINRGRIELRTAPVLLETILQSAIRSVQPMIIEKNHVLLQNLNSPLPIQGDADRLEQVFVNLLANAIKYTPEMGRISVEAHQEASSAVIRITDTGIGIPPDLLPHVFELFTQAGTSLDRAQGGLGIGLTVVRTLVEMHGGKVTAESGPEGPGTRLIVQLPLCGAAPSDSPAPVGMAREAPALANLRVLIVDDHVDTAQSMGRLLSRRNCEVQIAHDGPSGLLAANDFRPDVLLLDLGLPGFDGFQLARNLKAQPEFSHTLFIAISGYAQESDTLLSHEAGFHFHFAKPVDLNQLTTVMRQARG